MNTLEPPPSAAPPPFPRNRIPPDYREKVRRYASAQRGFYARSGLRRVIALELTAAIAAIVADIHFEMPESWRWAVLGTLTFVGLGLLALWWWWPALALSEDTVIRKLEHLLPKLGQRLRTSREAENATCALGLTGAFASGLVADTRVRMSSVNLDTLIPWKTIRLSLYVCLAVVATFLVLLVRWPDFRVGAQRLFTPGAGATFTTVAIEDGPDNFKEDESPLIAAVVSGRPVQETNLFTREEGQDWKPQKMDRAEARGRFTALLTGRKDSFEYYVVAGDARSETRHMKCLLTPRIEKVENVVRLPDYIGGPPIKTAGGDVKAVEDSTVTVDFQINPPLTDATAHLNDGRDLPLKISGNHVIFELKVARGEVVYQLSGSDADHLYLPPTNFKITGFEDKPPEVELVEPKKDLEATTVWEILARLRAKDDFGLAEVGIVLVVGNEIKMIAHRDIAEKDVRAVSEMGTAALEDFPLTLNDNLKIYAFARDHKPRDGARSVSRLVAIDIRQFQVRWRVMEGGKGGLPMSGEHLATFFNLIKEQRKVVSDAFLLSENGVPSGGDLGAECDKIRIHEDAVAAQTTKLKEKVAEEGTMNADDLTMLDTAAQQMGEASGHLTQKLTRPAYKQADRALSSLLALRKKIMKLMSQSKSAMPSEAEEPPKAVSISDLAAEAERLAHEEHDVREKITPQLPAARDMEVVRHQQEVAVTDAGELFAAVVRHPNSSELALQRMESAENLMQKAEDQMKGDAAQEAAPHLKSAEDLLTALAAQLRALDEKNMEETMGKLALLAKEAKERMEKEQKERDPSQAKAKEGKNQSGGSQAGDQPKTSDDQKEKGEAKNDGQKSTGKAENNSSDPGKPDAKEKGANQKGSDDAPAASDDREGKAGAKNDGQKNTGKAENNSGDPGKPDAKEKRANPKGSDDAPAASDDREGKAGAKNDGQKNTGKAENNSSDPGKPDAKEKGTNSKRNDDEPSASADREGKAGAKNTDQNAAGDAANKSGDPGKQNAKSQGEDSKAAANPKENGTAAGGNQKGQETGADKKMDDKTGKKGANGIGKTDDAQEKGRGNTVRTKPAETDPKALEKTAEDAATIDDALKALAGKEGAGKEGERLAELRDRAKTEVLKPDVHALAGEKNDAAASEKAGELGQRFGKLAEGLNAEQRHLLQSHIEALTDLLARTRKLEQQAGEKGADGKNGKGEGKPQGAEGKQEEANAKQPENAQKGSPAQQAGEKGADGKNEKGEGKPQGAEGKQEEANAKQPENAQKGGPAQQAGEKGADGKNGKGEGKPQDAAGKQEEANAKQPENTQKGGPAQQAGEKGADGKNEKGEVANEPSQNAEKPGGENANRGPQTGRHDRSGSLGGGGGSKALGPYGGIRDIDPKMDYIKDLDRVADEHMRGLLAPLIEDAQRGAFDYSHLQAVAEHLGKMLDELVRDKSGERHASGVPDEYSHLVDEYFRALSEDFRSDARTPPEQSSPRK